MGNHASCIPRSIRRRTAKLVDAEGNLRRVDIPAVTAELMLEAPGHVVAHAEDVVRTRRVSGLQAHEQLRPGKVYLLLPMEQVGSRLSDRQIAVMVGAVESGKRRRKGNKSCGFGSQVFPEVARREEERFLEGQVTGFPGQRIGGCRPWMPMLDTIHEAN